MQVSLQALKAFEAAARLGSFKLAALELSLSPTAISHHISNLEQRLDVALFQRQARRISLTLAGERLSTVTTQGFQAINQTLDDIASTGRHIKVATTSSLAALVLIPALQQFYATHPQTQVEVATGEDMQHDAFTLPLRFGDLRHQHPDDVLKTEFFNMFATPAAASLPAGLKPLTIYTTRWKNNNLPPPPLTDWLSQQGLQDSGLDIKYYDQELFGIQQALAGQAWVFSSTTLTQQYVQAGILQAVNPNAVKSALCYYIPNKALLSNRHNAHFIDWLQATLNT
ncbi:LysR family transcriptional regulator [Shewanella mangrovisoli]|uniref:LysR family transcriptional regulator n=1 Tax=Shewanella mangrovisoli TaxID=2864211 RepID=UPI0035B6B39A